MARGGPDGDRQRLSLIERAHLEHLDHLKDALSQSLADPKSKQTRGHDIPERYM